MTAGSEHRLRRLDIALAIGLAVLAYGLGVGYLRTATTAGLKSDFYQFEFGPAVMLACGHGAVSPAEGEIPALDQFLRVERDSIRCEDLRFPVRLRELSNLQAVWKYQLWTAAAIWRMTGISWGHLVPLAGVFFGTTVWLAFALARFVSGRLASAAVAVAVMLSPLHWSQLPNLRDYSKAPFMLGLIALTVLVMSGPADRRRLIIVAASFGVLLGLGMGFRNDLLVSVPAFLAAVIVFLPGGLLRHIKLKIAAIAVAGVAFIAAALPLLGVYSSGGGMQVLALLGFVTPYDQPLHLERGPYEFGYAYNDWYMDAIVRDVAWRQHHVTESIPLYKDVFNKAATVLIVEIVRTWPADIVARAYASVVQMASLPASNLTDSGSPLGLPPGGALSRFFTVRSHALGHMVWIWPASVAAALVIGGALDTRLAAAATFLLLYFAGYPAVQFHERHFFHLNFLPFLAMAFLGTRIVGLVRLRGPLRPRLEQARRLAARGGVFALAVLLVTMVPLVTLRAYQTVQVRDGIERRLAASRASVPIETISAADHHVVLGAASMPARALAESHPGSVTSEYLVARFGGTACEALHLPVTLRYYSPFANVHLTTTKSIRMPPDPAADVQLLTPVFYRFRGPGDLESLTDRESVYQFLGFELDERNGPCLESVERITDTEVFPLQLTATLAPDWRDSTMYQTLADLEGHSRSAGVEIFTAPADLPVARTMLSSPLRPLTVEARADMLKPTGSGGWRIDGAGGIGGAVGPFVYLLTTRPEVVHQGDLLIVEGEMRKGGLTVGLVRDGKWLVQTATSGRDRFVAVVQVPSDGMATVVMANNLSDGSTSNSFEITRAGWIAGLAGR